MYAVLYSSLLQAGIPLHGLVAGDGFAAAPLPGLECFAAREASAPRRLRDCRRSVRRALSANEVSVVAAHFAFYALPVLDLLRGQRFVFHFHGPWASESEVERQNSLRLWAKHRVESVVYRRADQFIVLSESFRQVLQRQYRIAAERITVIPGGVEAARFATGWSASQARAHLGLPQDRPLITTVRRLVRRVGIELLLDAMTAIGAKVPEALLLIAGTGPLAEHLAQRIAALGLDDRVRMLGFVSDVDLPALYRASDLTVVPSLALEGFGLTTIESLASGTPVLVTPVGGLPEVVRDLEPALVLADASAAAIADAVTGALTGTSPLPSSEACRRYARERYDWPVIAQQVLRTYGLARG